MAVRRWPSWFSESPWRSASDGVIDSARARWRAVIECTDLARESRRPRGSDAADRDALSGEPLVGIVGAQASADTRRAT